MRSSLLKACQRNLHLRTFPKQPFIKKYPYVPLLQTAMFRPPHMHRPYHRIRRYRRAFFRRLFFLTAAVGTFYYFMDADFVTYGYDLYRSKFDLDGMADKTIWVIGASSGIGEYLVYDLLKSGAKRIIISSRRQEKLKKVQQQCQKLITQINNQNSQSNSDINATVEQRVNAEIEVLPDDGNKDLDPSIVKQIEQKVRNELQKPLECEIIVKQLDILDCLTDNSFADRYVSELMEELNSGFVSESERGGLNVETSDIDIVVINSGRTQSSYGVENTQQILLYLQQLNCFGPIEISKAMVKYWRNHNNVGRKNKKFQIAVTSSIAGVIGAPKKSAYSMSKASIMRYLEAMRIELINDRIDINLICPGPISLTPDSHPSFGASIDAKKRSRYEGRTGTNMTLERCASLYCTALQYSLIEAWISPNPVLLLTYLRQYLPILHGPLGKLLGSRYAKAKDEVVESRHI